MTCAKVKFRSKEDADNHIKRIIEKSKKPCRLTKSYLCTKCKTWHLTSQGHEEKMMYEKKILILKQNIKNLEEKNKNLREQIVLIRNRNNDYK